MKERIKYNQYIHPQSEIQKLVCNSSKAKTLLQWEAVVSLEEGVKKQRVD